MAPWIEFGDVRLPWYGVWVVVGGLVATFHASRRASASGVPKAPVLVLAGVLSAVGVAVARAFTSGIEHAGERGGTGMSLFGVVAAGIVLVPILAWAWRIEPWRLLDVLAPAAVLAIGFGRLGCLSAGCCFGAPTLFPIALVFREWDAAARPLGVPLHAVQIYDALGCVAIVWMAPFAGANGPPPPSRVNRDETPYPRRGRTLGFSTALRRIGARKRAPGMLGAATLAAYGLLRWGLEHLRGDYRGELWGVAPTQWTALALLVISSAVVVGRSMVRPTAADRVGVQGSDPSSAESGEP